MVLSCLRFVFWTVPVLLWDGLRLLGFVIMLSPGFARFAWYYGVVADRSSVRYGHDSCRQTLDVFESKALKETTCCCCPATTLPEVSENEAANAEDFGFRAFLDKPVSGERLLETVMSVLDRRPRPGPLRVVG